MASTLSKAPILRATAVRSYSCQAVPIGGTTTYKVENSTLQNKLVVCSAENDSPLSRVSIVFRAGSRYEGADNLGVSHMLRMTAGQSTRNWSNFAIARRVAQSGATLSCTADREVVAYTLEGTRAAVAECLPYLTSVATEQLFQPWEISDQEKRVRLELATRPPQLRCIDLLHKAAYRKTLGNSLFIAKYNIGKIGSETLQHYVRQNFTPTRGAVVGLGIDHSKLEQIGQCLKIESCKDEASPAKYAAGEIRSDKGGDMAYVAIASQSAGICQIKEALAFGVLQRALGSGPSTKYGMESASLLRKAIGDIRDPHSVSAINYTYSDSGLFGVLAAMPAKIAGQITTSVVKTLKSLKVSDADVNRGKNQYITDILTSNECGRNAIERMGREAALTGTGQSPCEIIAEIQSVSASDVQAAAQKISSGKLTIAAVGNLHCVPFKDEL
nr:cytochrome b-c1 complex subunit 2, mitochondrial [Onthophagus taurus]